MTLVHARRHAFRLSQQQHITRSGIFDAQNLGRSLGPIDMVITSTQPRAWETSVAMGLQIDRESSLLDPRDELFACLRATWSLQDLSSAMADEPLLRELAERLHILLHFRRSTHTIVGHPLGNRRTVSARLRLRTRCPSISAPWRWLDRFRCT